MCWADTRLLILARRARGRTNALNSHTLPPHGRTLSEAWSPVQGASTPCHPDCHCLFHIGQPQPAARTCARNLNSLLRDRRGSPSAAARTVRDTEQLVKQAQAARDQTPCPVVRVTIEAAPARLRCARSLQSKNRASIALTPMMRHRNPMPRGLS